MYQASGENKYEDLIDRVRLVILLTTNLKDIISYLAIRSELVKKYLLGDGRF